jgi:GTP-binding protein EngB required for normal cell division
MKKIIIFFTAIFTSLILYSCQTVSNKIDEKSAQEEKELSKWLNQPESELKIVFGKPDRVEFTDTRNRYYVYVKEKLKIKCERKFEINPKNMIVGFSSKNCF